MAENTYISRFGFWLLPVCLAFLGGAAPQQALLQSPKIVPHAKKLLTPQDFLAGFAALPSHPVVLMTRQDAVVEELLTNSKSLSYEQALRTAAAICDEAHQLGYDPLLFLAVIHVESAYNHLATSYVGAVGLMQLMPQTADFVARQQNLGEGMSQPFDPVTNVRLGIRYLAVLHHRFNNRWDLALTAYNRGPGTAHSILIAHHGAMPRAVGSFYASKVLAHYQLLSAAYGQLPVD